MTTSRENNLDKRQLLHSKILNKFGDRLVGFEDVLIVSTEIPVEVTCKTHGVYMLRPCHALKWRGKGAPYCPDCNRRGPKVGAKYKPHVITPPSPEDEKKMIIKSLTSADRWSRFYKFYDISLDKWRKKVRTAIKEIEETTTLDNLYETVSSQMDMINGWIMSEDPPPSYLVFKSKVCVASEELV